MAMVNVLIVGMTATIGGLENFIISYCERMAGPELHFDFLTRFPACAYEDRIRAMGGEVYHVTRRSRNPLRYYREIHGFFARHAGKYAVIWDHECMVNDLTPLRLAKKAGIPVRLYHSHNTQNMDVSLKGRVQGLLHRWNRRRLPACVTELWGCSAEAIRWATGGKGAAVTRIVPNAIDTRPFGNLAAERDACRKELGVENCFVIGHTGRLQYQKNQRFLLDAFAGLYAGMPQARLALVGDGPDAAMLRARALELGVMDAVLFLGFREDIPRLLSAMDLFAFPSRFEGLGLSVIEAQASGLPCLVSAAVPQAAHLTDLVTALPTRDAAVWAKAMAAEAAKPRARADRRAEVAKAGYEIGAASAQLATALLRLAAQNPRPKPGRYILSVPSAKQYAHALTKARVDTQRFAVQNGFQPLVFRGGDTASGRVWAAAKLVLRCVADWLSAFRRLPRNATLLVQYPHFPLKSVPVARAAMRLLQRRKGVRLIALVHDLDSLRGIGGNAAVYSDRRLLPIFDAVICHNAVMENRLVSMGLCRERLVTLGLFDYATDAEPRPRAYSQSVCIAGNLSPAKSGYLYQMLGQPTRRYQLHLYGGSFEGENCEGVAYHGVFDANELPGRLEGAFGLIWDGDTTAGCSGVYGEYLRINAPHKLSLYLAAGIPVLIWAQAAQAAFVTGQGVGLALENLDTLDKLLTGVTPEDYRRMAENAAKLSPLIRDGHYLTQALETALQRLSANGGESDR